VYPVALLARFRPDLAGDFPEPECTIGDGEPRRHVEPAPLQIEQQTRQSCALSRAPSARLQAPLQ